jgi:hypothetical protein
LKSSKYFEVGPDTPEGEDFEFSIIIPRGAVDNELDQFGRELVKLDRLFRLFCELATGSRDDFKIKAVSSSDLTILLHAVPAVALILVTTFERIAAAYERLLNIITLQRGLKKTNAPDSVLEPMRKFIEKTVKAELESAAKELERGYLRKIDQGRRQELKTELRNALKEISSRYDRGYVFDVRGNETDLINETEDPASKEPPSIRRVVAEKRQRLKLPKAEDTPILGLPEPNKDVDG